jgi:hypothetical protein
MTLTDQQLRDLVLGMRTAYARGENAMEYARGKLLENGVAEAEFQNHLYATLIAYDLQSGSYVKNARENPRHKKKWCQQVAGLIEPFLPNNGLLLEVGVGEATTLAGVLDELEKTNISALGFDISWSRIQVANQWLEEAKQRAQLFVGDLTNIPLADSSVDVLYSSHSLEPNGGLEEVAVAECLRVARRGVVLVEPLYELAPEPAQERMRAHGYVRGLRSVAENLGATVHDYRLLDYTGNPLNPSGVLAISKPADTGEERGRPQADTEHDQTAAPQWRCPLTGEELEPNADAYFAAAVGIAYPVLRGIPLLRPEHAIVASGFASEPA